MMKFRLLVIFTLIFCSITNAQTKEEKLEICSYLISNKEIDEDICKTILERGKSNLYIEKIRIKTYTKLGDIFFVKSLISGGKSFLYFKNRKDILLLGKEGNDLLKDLNELESFVKKNDFTEYEFVTFCESIIKYILLINKNNSYIEQSNKLYYFQVKE